MAVLVNNVDCGVSKKGTGVIDCVQELGKPNGFILVDNNWELDIAAGTFDLAYVNTQIALGNFVPFMGSVDFADNSEETVFETFSSGVKSKVRDGLAEFDFTYIKGYHWHAAAYSHNGFGDKAVVLVWENGVLGFDTSGDGTKIKGLKRGYLDVKTFQNNDGAASSKTMIGMQLLNTKNYNSNMSLLNEAGLGFTIDEIKGAVDTKITVVGTPAAAATSVVVTATASSNSAVTVVGLQAADFNVTSQTVASIVYDATAKTYTLTTDALTAGDKTVSLGASPNITATVANVQYSGGSSSFTVA